jgi:uncharacterized protein YndB with AHSA1/START domain
MHIEAFSATSGGAFSWVHEAPNGQRLVTRGEFRDVRPNRRIVMVYRQEGDLVPPPLLVETVTLRPADNGRTEIKRRIEFETVPERDASLPEIARTARRSYERLAALLAELQEGEVTRAA